MGKPNPYYRNDEEKAALIAMRDAFSFELPVPSNLVIGIAGPPGNGKTHLLCTLAGEEYGPLYLLDSEIRAHLVTKKFTAPIKTAPIRSYKELVAGMKWILKNVKPPGIIAVDSGSDLQTFAEEEYLERVGREKVGLQWNWPEVWALVNAIVDEVKFSGFTFAFTTRVKDEYSGEKATGNIVPRIYSGLPYKCDLFLQFDKTRTPTVVKNGFHERIDYLLTRQMSLPEIIKTVQDQNAPAAPPPEPKPAPPAKAKAGAKK